MPVDAIVHHLDVFSPGAHVYQRRLAFLRRRRVFLRVGGVLVGGGEERVFDAGFRSEHGRLADGEVVQVAVAWAKNEVVVLSITLRALRIGEGCVDECPVGLQIASGVLTRQCAESLGVAPRGRVAQRPAVVALYGLVPELLVGLRVVRGRLAGEVLELAGPCSIPPGVVGLQHLDGVAPRLNLAERDGAQFRRHCGYLLVDGMAIVGIHPRPVAVEDFHRVAPGFYLAEREGAEFVRQ